MRLFKLINKYLTQSSRGEVFAWAICGIVVVGSVDYITGFELSVSFFYLAPIAIASWYLGRRLGTVVAILSAAIWYVGDVASGNTYSDTAILVWNSLIHFGFFLFANQTLATLHQSFTTNARLAQIDPLTNLYNRRSFEDRLHHDIDLVKRRRGVLSLAFVDLDNFKVLNDTYGHAEGDRALKLVGEILKHSVRITDTAARIGGDEFAIVLPDTDSEGAKQIISKFRNELTRMFVIHRLDVTCSIGVVTLIDSITSAENVLAAADSVMYDIKRKGKNEVSFAVLGEVVQPFARSAIKKIGHLR